MEKDYLYNVAVHEAGHAVMAVYQGGAVTELAIGDEVKEEGTAGYCKTAVDGFMAKVWTSLAGPVTSAIHEDTRVWEQFAFGGGQADFDRTFDLWLDLLVPHSLRAEFGFPEDIDSLTTYVEAVLEGWKAERREGRRNQAHSPLCPAVLAVNRGGM